MQVLDVDSDDPNVKRDAWFAYVNQTQTGVDMVGTGRFGYWEEKPEIVAESDLIIIGDTSKDADEPVLIITTMNQVTCYVAKASHLEATPLPVARVTESP